MYDLMPPPPDYACCQHCVPEGFKCWAADCGHGCPCPEPGCPPALKPTPTTNPAAAATRAELTAEQED